MPLELIGDIPNSAVFREYQELELKPDEVRLKSIFSSVKHGTELRAFRGDSADAMEPWDGRSSARNRKKARSRFLRSAIARGATFFSFSPNGLRTCELATGKLGQAA